MYKYIASFYTFFYKIRSFLSLLLGRRMYIEEIKYIHSTLHFEIILNMQSFLTYVNGNDCQYICGISVKHFNNSQFVSSYPQPNCFYNYINFQ